MTRTLAKKLAHVKPGTLYVGVDLGLDRNVAVVINQGAQRLREDKRAPNPEQGACP